MDACDHGQCMHCVLMTELLLRLLVVVSALRPATLHTAIVRPMQLLPRFKHVQCMHTWVLAGK